MEQQRCAATWRRRVSLAAALALSSLGLVLPARAVTTIVLNEFVPPGDPINTKIVNPWTKEVEKATDGRVIFTILPTSVAAPDQLWSAVTGGIVDAAYLFNGLLPKQLPLEQIAALPFIPSSSQGRSVALWRTYKKFFEAKGEYRQVKLLAIFTQPGGGIFSAKKQILKPDDLAGMRLWALPGVPQKLFQGLKAGVVSRPAVQMSELVTGGTVDALAGLSPTALSTFKVLDYMKSETTVPGDLTAPAFSLIINKAKWESIPAKDRAIIKTLSGEALARRCATLDAIDKAIETKALKAGLKVAAASPELIATLHKQGAPIVAAWLAAAKQMGVDGPAALKYFSEQAGAGTAP